MEKEQAEALNKVITGLIETETAIVNRNEQAIERKTQKEVAEIRASKAKIEEWEKAKAGLAKLPSK